MSSITRLAGLCLGFLAQLALAGTLPLPRELSLPSSATVQEGGSFHEFSEHLFVPSPGAAPRVQQGHHWVRKLALKGLPESATNFAVRDQVLAALKGGGWQVVDAPDSLPASATLHFTKGEKNLWAEVSVSFADDIDLRLVEVAPVPFKVTLKAPAAKPEPIPAEKEHFAFFAPLPGSSGPETRVSEADLMVASNEQPGEWQRVAPAALMKQYTREDLSNALLLAVYRPALQAAGWTIHREVTGQQNRDAYLEAHYTANRRNLWAVVSITGVDTYEVRIADLATRDLAAILTRECRVSLDGLTFDFNKATLRPESDAVLATALAALKANASRPIEVQGHTDNVGSDDYNQKLSEDRATAVMKALIARGASATQLSARGYGKQQPATENDTPEGRARNRRVELTCRK